MSRKRDTEPGYHRVLLFPILNLLKKMIVDVCGEFYQCEVTLVSFISKQSYLIFVFPHLNQSGIGMELKHDSRAISRG